MNTQITASTIALSLICVVGGCEQKSPNATNTSNTAGQSASDTRAGNRGTSMPSGTSTYPGTTTSTNQTNPANPTTRPADNTGRNEIDRSGNTQTPPDQSEASADIAITAAIRRAIMDDKSMSVNAQNCKIMTGVGGIVTLRGAVNTQAEKDAIGNKARAVAGVTRVDNQLEVAAQ